MTTNTTNADLKSAGQGLNIRPVYIVGVLVAVIGFAFFNGIGNLFQRWGEQQELSHGYFLPLIAAWMVWARRDALHQSLGKPELTGLIGVGLAAIILALSEMTVTSLMIFQHLAMILLFVSLTLALGGRSIFWMTLVPAAYLLFMVPPPYWAITVLSQQFQLWSSQLGVWMIERFGIPVFLSGNIIDLGEFQLQVAEACSGLRYLFPFLSLGFLAAYLYKAPLWQRALVFLSTVPITIIMNSFRIAVTGILVDRFGASHAEGMVHFFEGWVVFLLCLIMLFGVIAVLARFSGKKDLANLLAMPEIQAQKPASPWNIKLFIRHSAIAIIMLAGAGVFVHFGTSNVLKIPARADLDVLPYEFSDWDVDIQQVDKATLEVLGADDYIIANMINPEKEQLHLYIAYLNMQRHGHSWHSPKQCIPGGGWQITHHDVNPVTLSDGTQFHYNRLIIENRGARQLVYYWYDQRGRKIANEFVMKGLLIFDAVRLRRTDGAMIRIMTPVSTGEALSDADARLKKFMQELHPKLPAYIPPAEAPAENVQDSDI